MVPSPEPALGVMLPMWPSRRPSKPRREASQGESHDCTSLEAGAQACRPLADLAYGIPLAVPRIPFLSVLELEAESSIGLILEDD